MLDWAHLDKYRENNRLEAKKAQGGLPHSIWETYSAFANTFGGIILLGVVEGPDKAFRSVPLPDPDQLIADFWNTIGDPDAVSVNILNEQSVQVAESGGNRIVVVEVPRADRHDRPVYIGRDPFSGTYRRSGEGDYRCTADEVRAMMRDRADISQDTRVMEHMTEEVLAEDTVCRYRALAEQTHPEQGWSALPAPAFLQCIGAAAPGKDKRLHPTAAGLLMFGREPEILREFPNYLLDYQERDDTAPAGGTVRILSGSGGWSGNLFDFYCRVSRRLCQTLSGPDGGAPEDPLLGRALREALVNALTHADYYDRRGLLIQKLPNQIRIANPGAFRVDARKALNGGVSDPRNAALIRMFHLIGTGGEAGGLSAIRAVWQARGWQAPEILESFGPDRTVLTLPLSRPAASGAADPEACRQRIVEFLTEAAAATAREIAEGLGLPGAQVAAHLSALAAQGALTEEADGQGIVRYCLKA